MATTGPKSFLMSEVKAKMGRYASTNFFHVFFTTEHLPSLVNTINTYGGGSYQNFIDIACIDATLPGSTFATHEATNDHMGITERHAYRRQFDGKIDFTFAIDREYTLIKYFEAWMGYIGGEASDGYINHERGRGYRVPFIQDYACPKFHLVKYEKDATIVEKGYSPTRLTYTFVNAYPIAIASMPISQGPTDLLTMTVTMDYQKYYIKENSGSGKGATGSDNNNDKVPEYDVNVELKGGIDRDIYGNNGDIPQYQSPELKGGIDRDIYGGSKPVQPNNDQPQVSKKPPRVNSDTSFQPNAITDEDRALVEEERRVAKEGLDFY